MLCDDATITEVNEEWRGKAEPTDVLSYELPASDFDHVRDPASCAPRALPGTLVSAHSTNTLPSLGAFIQLGGLRGMFERDFLLVRHRPERPSR